MLNHIYIERDLSQTLIKRTGKLASQETNGKATTNKVFAPIQTNSTQAVNHHHGLCRLICFMS